MNRKIILKSRKNNGQCSLSIFKSKKGLGRGISSLIGDTKNTSIKNISQTEYLFWNFFFSKSRARVEEKMV